MRIRPIVPAAVMLLLSASLAAPAAPPAASTPAVAVHERADLRDAVAKQVDAHLKEWLDLYRTIHAAPELSLSEVKSAQRMADLFRRAGFAVTPELGGHGVVGMLANGDGPVILIRGDMDALPVIEETGLPYASTVKIEQGDGSHVGVMHACGHDVHQTVLAATGQVLASLKDRWRGTVLLVAQPAEEIGRGARMMIDDGLFTKFPKPTACIALHVAADMETGIVATTPGWYAANVDSIDIRIYGKGGHGAYPHWARDPIVAAAQVIVSLQTIISRRNDPIESAVVTVGSIHGGSKHNIIPSEVDLQLTVRTYRDDVRKMVLDEIRSITVHTCQAMGLPREPDVHVRDQEFTPAGYNDPALTAGAATLFTSVFGAERVIERPPSMGGEDFGQFAKAAGVPGMMFNLGTIAPERVAESKKPGGAPLPSIHSSRFAPVPEPTVRTGVTAMTDLALGLLAKP